MVEFLWDKYGINVPVAWIRLPIADLGWVNEAVWFVCIAGVGGFKRPQNDATGLRGFRILRGRFRDYTINFYKKFGIKTSLISCSSR